MQPSATRTPENPDARSLAHRLGRGIEAITDAVLDRLRPTPSHVTIEAYLGHGSADQVIVRGRAVAGRPIRSAAGTERAWRRFRRMVARFSTHDLDGVTIDIGCGDHHRARVVTDDEGYYTAQWNPTHAAASRVAPLTIAAVAGVPDGAEVHVDGDPAVALVDTATRHLVVSDIDDTILATGVGRQARMVARTLTSSAWSRHQVDGMPALLRCLRDGPPGSDHSAFFYVSSSPWNLYGFLRAFLGRHGCPHGPLFLSDYGITDDVFVRADHEQHKLAAIEEICAVHAAPMLLVGDTTEADPAIYAAVARRHPGRVRAVFLHDSGADADARRRAQAVLDDADVAVAIGDGATLQAAARRLGLT